MTIVQRNEEKRTDLFDVLAYKVQPGGLLYWVKWNFMHILCHFQAMEYL